MSGFHVPVQIGTVCVCHRRGFGVAPKIGIFLMQAILVTSSIGHTVKARASLDSHFIPWPRLLTTASTMTRFFSASVLLSLWLCVLKVVVQAKDVYFNLELEAVLENELSPDCMNIQQARRYMFLANRQMPGPLIEADEGDTIHVSVPPEDARISCLAQLFLRKHLSQLSSHHTNILTAGPSYQQASN